METITRSEEETKIIAYSVLEREVNKKGRKNALVVTLSGELGSGKTAFVKGFAGSLGVENRVLSPTFVIERRYSIKKRNFSSLIHIDAYRLSSGEDLRVLDWESKLKNNKNIICLEWPENVSSAIPTEAISVYFRFVTKNERAIKY